MKIEISRRPEHDLRAQRARGALRSARGALRGARGALRGARGALGGVLPAQAAPAIVVAPIIADWLFHIRFSVVRHPSKVAQIHKIPHFRKVHKVF